MKVYIVDDTAFIRILCRYHLTKAGFEVIGESNDGAEAIDQITSLQPDCVIVDLALPTKNGVEVMSAIQSQFPHIQFIILSALDEDVMRAYKTQVQYHTYLVKPFEEKQLISAVKCVAENNKKDLHG